MEVRDTYAVPAESEPLRRFLSGEPAPEYDKSDWTDLIRGLAARGAAMSRIRIVTVPLSDYQRWLLTVTGESVEAGEDIRYTPRHTVDPSDMPSDDWWLFDDAIVAFNLVGQDGRAAGMAITADPGIAAYCQAMKQRLWWVAKPFREYVDESTGTAR
jgi:hypothetical protein